MPALLILVSIGMLIGTWTLSGTIPMIVDWGLKSIQPSWIVVLAFLITMVVSTVTGTSWGAVGTVGVALIGVAGGLGVSLPMTAGAIISGAYFGDKMSPMSDTTNLAPRWPVRLSSSTSGTSSTRRARPRCWPASSI